MKLNSLVVLDSGGKSRPSGGKKWLSGAWADNSQPV